MNEHIFNFHDTVLLATGFQSLLFIFLVLFVKHERHISDYFLIGFFVAQIAIPAHILINYNVEIRQSALAVTPLAFHIFDLAFWIEGPLLFWFTRSILNKDPSWHKRDALLLIPVMIYFLYLTVTFYSVDEASKLYYLAEEQRVLGRYKAIEAVRESFRLLFGVLCLMLIRQARNEIRDRFSNIDKIDIGWLNMLVVVFTLTRSWVLLVVIITIFAADLGKPIFNYLGLIGNYLTFGLITTLMFSSLQRSTVFYGQIENVKTTAEPTSIEIDPVLIKKIQDHMSNKKPYLMHLLNLDQLAMQLDMHPRALSMAIKHQFKTNFYEFINSYRIKEAKSILSNPDKKHKTMIEVSGDCGFNSKATFNSFFKKIVDTTPTQYRLSNLVEKKQVVAD